MLNTPFSPWPSFTEEEAQAVQRVLLSNKVNYWTGQEGRRFEEEFAEFSGCSHAIAVANGTLALDLALKGIALAVGDEVIVTSRTFIASASSIVTAGCVPVFADVDSDSQNITGASIEAVITPKTRAIICVHLAGWSCDMDPIMELAAKYNLKVIEDCAQAHGAKYKGRSVGSIGDIGCWSFCQDKIMTTGGEGGMVTTNDRGLWLFMWAYKDHGKSWQAVYEKQHEPGFRWLHESFGTNWRLTEMQSAIGRIQLKRMPIWLASRTKNAHAIIDSAHECSALRVPQIEEESVHAWYKCYVFIRPELLKEGWSRDRIIENFINQGVPCFSGSCSEVYLESAFDNTNWRPASHLPVAKKLGETSLMFLVHPTLAKAEVDKTCDVLRQVMSEATA
ncbi:MAG: DegT/DnrJ/EryC1/StrS family aminotransferase [Pseudomonadales bacterium]